MDNNISCKFFSYTVFHYRVIDVGMLTVKGGFEGCGPVAMATKSGNSTAKHFFLSWCYH